MPVIHIGAHSIEYRVTIGTSRRYTYFRFTADKTLEVIIPRGRSVDVDSAIRDRQSWIVRRYNEISRNKRILEEDRIMFNGEQLNLIFQKTQEKEELVHDSERKEVTVWSSEGSRVRELIRRWFLRETSRYVVRRLGEFADDFGIKYHMADVRQMRNWGYCTRDGRLSFNWQLIALPERLRDYIILHELAHLSEFNHSRAFKQKLAAACPDYRQREKELNNIVSIQSW